MYITQDSLLWVNLLVFTSLALVFEVYENIAKAGPWSFWKPLGYTKETYDGDSAVNSASDVLFSLVGWGLARLVLVSTGLTAVGLGLTLGAAALLLGLFLILHCVERGVNDFGKQITQTGSERPALVMNSPPGPDTGV